MMTPDAKKALAATIQSLRTRLLVDLRDATESAYQLSIPRAREASLSEAGRVRRGRLEAYIAEPSSVKLPEQRGGLDRAEMTKRFGITA